MTDQLERNKQTVLAFYEQAVNQRNDDAARKFIGDPYIQHRADAADGPDGLREFMARMRTKYPESHCAVKRVFADGDYVILHVHVVRTPGAIGSKHVDIFRVEHERVVEHWDIDDPIAAESANPNGPF